MRSLLIIAILFLCTGAPLCAAADHEEAEKSGALTLVETAKDKDGRPLYTLKAERVPLADLLRSLFLKMGQEFSIAQDVRGTVDLYVQNASLEQALARVEELARPPIKIARGKFARVTRASEPLDAARAHLQRLPLRNNNLLEPLAPGYPPVVPGGYPASPAFPGANRPINLDIPEDRPIPLSEALRQIEQQARVPIRLDRNIPRDVAFSARFVQTPMGVALDSIAKTGALKWMLQPDGALLIAPTDRLRLFLGELALSASACPQCGAPLLRSWRFCPHCGQTMARLTPNRLPASPRKPDDKR